MIFINLFCVLYSASALLFTHEQQPQTEVETQAGTEFQSSRAQEKGIESMSSTFRAAEKAAAELEEGVLVFIPGESENPASNLRKTMRWLQTQSTLVDCIIYEKEKKIRKTTEAQWPCKTIETHGQTWMDHILKVPLSGTAMRYVLHLLGDVEVQAVDLDRMIRAMEANGVVHAAPALYGTLQSPQMKPHVGFGRKVKSLEYHMDLFTRSNFACFQDLVDSIPAESRQAVSKHYGYFLAHAMPTACPGGMAVVDAMKMFKLPGANNKTEAFLSGERWEEPTEAGKTDAEEPLSGDLMPGDPQCNGDASCVCPTACEAA